MITFLQHGLVKYSTPPVAVSPDAVKSCIDAVQLSCNEFCQQTWDASDRRWRGKWAGTVKLHWLYQQAFVRSLWTLGLRGTDLDECKGLVYN